MFLLLIVALLTACAPYNHTQQLNLKIDNLTYRQSSNAVDAIYEAVATLEQCKYFRHQHEGLHAYLATLIQSQITLAVVRHYDPNGLVELCGTASFHNNTISFDRETLDVLGKYNGKCEGAVFIAVHELIHLLGEMDEQVVEEIVWKCVK